MSIWMRASSSPNRKFASAFDSSVLPTPDGPAKMNDPDGRLGSFRPARVRRMACDTDRTASCWPVIPLCSWSSMWSRRVVSLGQLDHGDPGPVGEHLGDLLVVHLGHDVQIAGLPPLL